MEKILVVEDNPANLELIVDILEVNGYKVMTTATAKEGIELTRRELPNLILMDMQLPGMDGYEATKRIKQDPRIKGIPVVAITSYALAGDKEKVLESGCDGYIVKPIDTRKIVGQIKGFLKGGQNGKEDTNSG